MLLLFFSNLQVAQRLVDLGCYEISLGDTIGIGSPGKGKRPFFLDTVLNY